MASGLRPGAVDRGRLPVQQRDRRAALSALALLLVVAGALGSALVVYRSGHRTDVLVASHEIKPGQLITDADFSVARVANDGGAVVAASSKALFIGTHALSDIPAGALVSPHMFLSGSSLPAGGVVVGVTLSAQQRPADPLVIGDLVRVYDLPKDNGSAAGAAGAKVLVDTARVVEVVKGDSDVTALSLLLGPADAQTVVLAAANGEIAVSRLPVTATPAIDMLSAPATTAAS